MFNRAGLLILLLFSLRVSAEPWRWGGGLGATFRVQDDVNPDYSSLQTTPEIFAKGLYHHIGAMLEVDQAHTNTSSGSLSIATTATCLQLWGRYEFLEDWRPFVSLGGGTYIDHISTSFQGSASNLTGTRGLLGLGTGLSTTFWNYILTEFEVRVSAVEQSKDPNFSGVLRVGFEL